MIASGFRTAEAVLFHLFRSAVLAIVAEIRFLTSFGMTRRGPCLQNLSGLSFRPQHLKLEIIASGFRTAEAVLFHLFGRQC